MCLLPHLFRDHWEAIGTVLVDTEQVSAFRLDPALAYGMLILVTILDSSVLGGATTFLFSNVSVIKRLIKRNTG